MGWRYWADRRDLPVPEKKFEVIITSGNNERKNFAVKFRFKLWDTEKNKLVNGTFIVGLSSVLKQFNLDLDVMRTYQGRTQFWTFETKDKEVREAFRAYLEDQDVEEDAIGGLTSVPPLRGTLIHGEQSPAFLYTTGFIQALGTYPGSTVPCPVEFSWSKKSSTIKLLAKDILALSRLDWNNSDYCKAKPVTISVSQMVGDILAESSSKKIDPPASYSFYM